MPSSAITLAPREPLTKGNTVLPVQEMRAGLKDLFVPKPWVYWVDFLASAGLGWTCFGAALMVAPASPAFVPLLIVAASALYRAIAFIHELAHLRRGDVPGFRIAWNLLCGIPLLLPDFFYGEVHLAHHSKRDYGTAKDAEYLPFAAHRPRFILAQIPVILALPVCSMLRFALVGPLSFLHPRLRRLVETRMSAVAMKLDFGRAPSAKPAERRLWLVQEAACSLLALGVLAAVGAGLLAPALIVQWYLMAAGITSLNFIRAIGATHRYRSNETPQSFTYQFLDSVNVTGRSPATLLICPVGLRFHALHHLFPSLPYHALGEAHSRLMRRLPEAGPYRATLVPSVWAGCTSLWREAGTQNAGARQSAVDGASHTT